MCCQYHLSVSGEKSSLTQKPNKNLSLTSRLAKPPQPLASTTSRHTASSIKSPSNRQITSGQSKPAPSVPETETSATRSTKGPSRMGTTPGSPKDD